MKKDVEKLLKELDSLDINNNEALVIFKEKLNKLPFHKLKDQHPFNARLVLVQALDLKLGLIDIDEVRGSEDFEFCKEFFKRAMGYLYEDFSITEKHEMGMVR